MWALRKAIKIVQLQICLTCISINKCLQIFQNMKINLKLNTVSMQ